MGRKNVLVIGLGQIGYSNAEYISSKGLHVDGYDISEKAIQRALHTKIIHDRTLTFEEYDYYIICISTHRPDNMFMPFLDGLFGIVRKISVEGKTNALVGIDSTIPRGTSNTIKEILGHRLHVVHVPHRFYINEQREHGVKQTRVLGGCEQCCVSKGVEFYGDILDIPLHVVKSVEIAELSKVIENSYRFLEIAFAEELKMVCDNSMINFDDLRAAVNTKWNIKVLEAKDGIGGHCLPKDSQMYLDMSKNYLPSNLIEAAKKVDENYRRHMLQGLQITKVAQEKNTVKV
jgi:UDP-N-acetyl-D-mannosaminuronic acid dehydrogenase